MVRKGVLEVSFGNRVLAWLADAKAYLDGLDDASDKSRHVICSLDFRLWLHVLVVCLSTDVARIAHGRLELGWDQ